MRSPARDATRLGRLATWVVAVIVALIAVSRVTGLVVDWMWFASVGYAGVFRTIFLTQALLFLAVFAVSAGALWLSGWLAHRSASQAQAWRPEVLGQPVGEIAARVPWRAAIAGVAVLVGLLMAVGELSSWAIALRYFHQVPFGKTDPIFAKDIGFYFFTLPAYLALRNWLLLLLGCSAVLAGVVYGLRGDIALVRSPRGLSPAAATHGSALLGLFFALQAWSYWLDRFMLLYGDNGVVVGASYTDVHVGLPVLWLQVGLAAAAAAASWANMRWRDYRVPAAAALLVVGSAIVLGTIWPALFQRFYVKPNELQLETPYLQIGRAHV